VKSTKPTTYLTVDELKEMALLKLLDASSGPSGARRNSLLEEANALEELVNVRKRSGRL
jgi:hypothetical protein